MSTEKKLIKYIPLIHNLYSNGASLKLITNTIISKDENLATAENLYKQISSIYLKFKRNTLYNQYSQIKVLKIPEELSNDNYVTKYFYKYSNWHLALKNTINHYNLYLISKDEFINSSSIIIIDKLYCKRIMRWFEIDDIMITNQAKNTLSNYSDIAENCKTELDNIETYYLKFYNMIHTELLKNLSKME